VNSRGLGKPVDSQVKGLAAMRAPSLLFQANDLVVGTLAHRGAAHRGARPKKDVTVCLADQSMPAAAIHS